MNYRDFIFVVDDSGDGFGNWQIVDDQVAILILGIFNFFNVLVKICQTFIDLVQI